MLPIKESKGRIEVIDVLRGITLLGIILVHFIEQYYAGQPPKVHENFGTHNVADNIVSAIIGIFISGKFYMIFSFLFGLSFFIQLDKSDGSTSFLIRFAWRLAVLFLIGFIHHLHYRGDILTIYALLGFGLFITFKLPNKALLILSLLLIFNLPSVAIHAIEAFSPTANPTSFFDADQKQLEQYYDTLKSGSYLEILQANIPEFKTKFEFQFFSGRIYITMGLFLLGLYAGRKKVFENVPFFKKLIRYGLWTLLGCIIFTVTFGGIVFLAKVELTQPMQFLIGGFLYDIFNAALASIYVGLIVTLFQKEKWKKRLMHFYDAGRMGLTTYLMQAVVGSFIFFSYGFGLLGDIGSSICAALGLIVFYLQIVVSKWWLSRFKFGPFEWLWRSLTYMKLQPLRKDLEQQVL